MKGERKLNDHTGATRQKRGFAGLNPSWAYSSASPAAWKSKSILTSIMSIIMPTVM